MPTARRSAALLAIPWVLAACGDLLGIEDRVPYGGGLETTGASSSVAASGTGDDGSSGAGDGGASSGGGSIGGAGSGGGEVPCSADLDSDPRHCGTCNHDCLVGECEEGRCQPYALAAPLSSAEYRYLRVEDGPGGAIHFARWRQPSGAAGAIYRLTKYTPQTASFVEALPSAGWVGDVQVDATHIFYANYSHSDSLTVRGIYRLSRAGGEPEQLVSDTPDQLYLGTYTLHLDGDELAFNSWFGGVGLGLLPKAGGAVTPIATFDGPAPHNDLYGNFELDDDWVYVGLVTTGVVRYPRDGSGEPEPLYLEGAGFPWLEVVALDDVHVYWRDNDRILWRAPKEGGGPIELVAPPSGRDLRLRDGYIYFASFDGKSILRKHLDALDDEPEVIVALDEESDVVGNIAFDEISLYWLGFGEGQVFRVVL